MVSKSITLLSSLEKKQNRISSIALTFSNNILSKTASLQRINVSLSLLFKKRVKNRHERCVITHNTFVQEEARVQNSLAAFRNINNNVYLSVNNILNKNNQSFSQSSATKNYKFTFLEEKNIDLKVEKHYRNKHNTKDINVVQNHINDSKIIQKNSVEEAFSFIETQKLKDSVSNYFENNSNENNMNASMRNIVQTFVYKTENVFAERVKELEKKITYLDEKSNKNAIIHNIHSLSKEQIVEKSHDLNDMSEKVYDFVIRKWEREQRRKGDLYA